MFHIQQMFNSYINLLWRFLISMAFVSSNQGIDCNKEYFIFFLFYKGMQFV